MPRLAPGLSAPAAFVPRRFQGLLIGALLLALLSPQAVHAAKSSEANMGGKGGNALEILGYIERVRVEPQGMVLSAKLDTGATTSSIDARDLEPFSKDGDPWIRFTIPDPKAPGKRLTLERKVVRTVLIKQHGRPSPVRPVVRMTFCFGHQRVDGQVTLTNRSKYRYPLLLGRNHMRKRVVVNPARRYTTEPDCPAP